MFSETIDPVNTFKFSKAGTLPSPQTCSNLFNLDHIVLCLGLRDMFKFAHYRNISFFDPVVCLLRAHINNFLTLV